MHSVQDREITEYKIDYRKLQGLKHYGQPSNDLQFCSDETVRALEDGSL